MILTKYLQLVWRQKIASSSSKSVIKVGNYYLRVRNIREVRVITNYASYNSMFTLLINVVILPEKQHAECDLKTLIAPVFERKMVPGAE